MRAGASRMPSSDHAVSLVRVLPESKKAINLSLCVGILDIKFTHKKKSLGLAGGLLKVRTGQ